MLKSQFIISFLVFVLSGASAAWGGQSGDAAVIEGVEDGACIQWSNDSGQEINKRQAERLYVEAYRWVEEHVHPLKVAKRPCIAVKVGASCPDVRIKGACANPVTSEIFIPKWTQAAPGTIAQGAISTMLLHLMDSKEITKTAQELLTEDSKVYLDFVPQETSKGSAQGMLK